MEQKTKIAAANGKQELVITREFDLPLALLFKAYEEAEIVEQWMGTKVLNMHVVYKSVALRDQILKLPFAQGINMAHDRLQTVVNNLYHTL